MPTCRPIVVLLFSAIVRYSARILIIKLTKSVTFCEQSASNSTCLAYCQCDNTEQRAVYLFFPPHLGQGQQYSMPYVSSQLITRCLQVPSASYSLACYVHLLHPVIRSTSRAYAKQTPKRVIAVVMPCKQIAIKAVQKNSLVLKLSSTGASERNPLHLYGV